MNKKVVGQIILVIGILGLVLKLIEPLLVTKGCFGYDCLYEIVSFGIPLILIIVGYKLWHSRG